MDRQTFRKSLFWGWVAAGASLVPASATVNASQPAATMLAMISYVPAAAEPSPNDHVAPPGSANYVRPTGHLFTPPPIPDRPSGVQTLRADPERPQSPQHSVRLAPGLSIPSQQAPLSSDILRRLPKTDPLSDDTLVEPFPSDSARPSSARPASAEPEPGILPPAADNALQLDNREPLLTVPAEASDDRGTLPADGQTFPELAPPEQPVNESPQADKSFGVAPHPNGGSIDAPATVADDALPPLDATSDQANSPPASRYTSPVTLQPPVLAFPVMSTGELTPEEYTPAELAPENLTSEDSRAAIEPGPSVELGPPVDVIQPSLGPDVNALHGSPPPSMFAAPGNDAVNAESLSSVVGSLMHLPPVEPDVPPAVFHTETDQGVRLAPPRVEASQNAIATAYNVTARIRKAENLMVRGACFAARAEMLQALKAIAQSLDEREGTRRHGDALAYALRAFQEAGDLTPRGSGLASPVNLELTIRGHRTPVLWNENVNRLTPVAAQQRYMAYAQEQLVEACRGDLAAAESLFALARISSVLENEKPESSLLCLPQAMVMYRAALEIDPRHGRAANELGVLLAGCGRYAEARDVLLHSISVLPTHEAWHNLSVVQVRLGNAELAQRAQLESMAAAPSQASQPDNPVHSVKWVDPETFRGEQIAPSTIPSGR